MCLGDYLFSALPVSAPRFHGYLGYQAGSSPYPGANGWTAACVQQHLHLRGLQLRHHHRAQHEREIHIPQTGGAVSDHGSDRSVPSSSLYPVCVCLWCVCEPLWVMTTLCTRLLRTCNLCLVPRRRPDFHQNRCGWRLWNKLFHLYAGNEGGMFKRVPPTSSFLLMMYMMHITRRESKKSSITYISHL